MRIPPNALALAAAMVVSPLAFAGSTAQQAISALGAAEGSAVTSNIFGLTGRFGQDQPQEWEILARRGEQFAMFIVDETAVLSYSIVRPKKSPKLATNAMEIDSNKAFKIANKAAIAASIGFDSLDYSLRPRSDHPAPVWIVNLIDVAGVTVGRVHIAADSGKLLRKNWDRQSLNAPPRPSAPATGGSRGLISDRRGSSIQTGSTADGVREGLAQVGTSIRNVFRKEEVSTQPDSGRPKTSKAKP